jgi:hypothetical protein
MDTSEKSFDRLSGVQIRGLNKRVAEVMVDAVLRRAFGLIIGMLIDFVADPTERREVLDRHYRDYFGVLERFGGQMELRREELH